MDEKKEGRERDNMCNFQNMCHVQYFIQKCITCSELNVAHWNEIAHFCTPLKWTTTRLSLLFHSDTISRADSQSGALSGFLTNLMASIWSQVLCALNTGSHLHFVTLRWEYHGSTLKLQLINTEMTLVVRLSKTEVECAKY